MMNKKENNYIYKFPKVITVFSTFNNIFITDTYIY